MTMHYWRRTGHTPCGLPLSKYLFRCTEVKDAVTCKRCRAALARWPEMV